MLQNKTAARESLLSRFYNQAKESFDNRKNSRFWFGVLLSAASDIQPNSISMDISKNQLNSLQNILSVVLSDMLSFYPKNPPQQVYRLLHVARSIHDLNWKPGETQFEGYHSIMYKVHFNNALGLFLIKNRQYSTAYQCFEFILQIIQNDVVDSCADIFLASISNYLSFVRIHQYSHASRKIAELLNHLHTLYQNLINKYIQLGCAQQSLSLLLATCKQHEIYLGSQFRAQIKLLIRKYEQGKLNIKRTKYYNEINNENAKSDHYLQKNIQYKSADIEVKRSQLNFINRTMYFHRTIDDKPRLSLRLDRDNSRTLEFSLETNPNQEPEFLVIKAQKRSSVNSHDNPNISKTLQLKESTQPQIKTISSQIKQKGKENLERLPLKRQKVYFKHEPIILKINYTLIQIMADGVILSDFLKQKKKFLNWYEVFFLIKKLRFSCIFQNSLPIGSFYDVGKILSNYVFKGQYDKGVAISDTPKELLQLNILTKIFWIEGWFIKIFIMNQYDINHIEMAIDCYLSEFQILFRNVTKSQYIEKLNKRIFQQFQKQQGRESKIFGLQCWKKKKETTIQELANQIKSQNLLDFPYIKSSPFKIVLLMPNNKQVLLYLKEKSSKQDDCLLLETVALHTDDRVQSILKIPFYRLNRYFPTENIELGVWIKKFGKFIIEGYLPTFQDYPFSFNNLQYFNVITYAKKIEMTTMGKFVTPVLAELIGSKNRIWGICIRFFDLILVKQLTTFIFNPYYQLLFPVTQLTVEQRKKFLLSHLIEGRVSITYKKLVECKLAGSAVNLIDYWGLIDF